MKTIIYADPRNVDLAVPQVPSTLTNIMKNYPLPYEVASNITYHNGDSQGVGMRVERGHVYPDYGIHSVTEKWPILVIKTGRAKIQYGSSGVSTADVAFSAGPLLVDGSMTLNIEKEIGDRGYEHWNPNERKPQLAIGLTPSGDFVHGVWDMASLYEVAQDMIDAGCHIVMKGDGGGSVGRLENGNLQGSNLRKLAAALVIRKVKSRITSVIETVLPKVDLDLNFARKLVPNFLMNEFACKCCGAVSVSPKFAELVSRLQFLRQKVGKPIHVTSGYRCAKHDKEVGTSSDPGCGPHTTGYAADIYVDGLSVDALAKQAMACGFTGVGRYYNLGFVHVDLRQPPSEWTV